MGGGRPLNAPENTHAPDAEESVAVMTTGVCAAEVAREIEVEWILTRALDLDPRECSRHLSPDERKRAARFKVEETRAMFVAGRGLLRLALAGRTGFDPREVPIELEPSGRPRLARANDAKVDRPLSFSLSHTAGLVALALSADADVGIDIEVPERRVDARALARRFFHASETSRIERLESPQRNREFLRIWTMRESVVKALGSTMAEAFQQEFQVRQAEGGDLIADALGARLRVRLFTARAGPDTAFVAVAASSEKPVRLFRRSPPDAAIARPSSGGNALATAD